MVDFKILNICKGVILFVSPLIPYKGISQDTGPGGVGTSANNVIWLDANQLGLGDGSSVATWTDVSGNGNDFTQGTPADQPTFSTAGLINSMPSVSFNGSTHFLETASISDLDTDELSYFIVFQNTSSLNSPIYGVPISTRTSMSNSHWRIQLKRVNASQIAVERYVLNSSGGSVISTSFIDNSTSTSALIVNSVWTASDVVYGRVNGGASVSTAGGTSTGFTHTSTALGFLNPFLVQKRYFTGDICEVIVFSEDINSAQEKIIHNYLSAKYGIPLDGLSIYAHGATHSSDVAGIGRENVSNTHLSARGTGIVSMTSAGFDADGEYLLWGHDNAGLTNSVTNTPASYAATSGVRLDQEWIVTEVGTAGAVTITVDLTGIEFGASDEYELLVDTDFDGDFSNALSYTMTDMGGSVYSYTISDVDLANNFRFTVGNTRENITSINDGNWNQTATWDCSCIPSGANNVVIAHEVTVSDAQAALDITINATGELIVDNGADFEIAGDVDCDNLFTVNESSSITLNGAAFQTLDFVGAVAFDELEVNNNNNVILNTGTFSFSGALLPTNGDIDFNSNSVTFLSSASGTAAIGPINGSISNLTNVTSQRFIEAGVAGWSEVGFPFAGTYQLSDWDDNIFMSGPNNFADGCATSGSGCFNSVTYWDPSPGENVGIDDATTPIAQGVGVDIYLGDNLNTFSANTLDVSGRALNLTGTEIIPVEAGWNLIANPFLCPVDWNLATLNNVNDYFWINDAEAGWLYYDGDGTPDFSNSADPNMQAGIISSYQGFWVFATANGSVTFDQTSKSVASPDAFVKSAEMSESVSFFTAVLSKDDEILPPSRTYFNMLPANSAHDYYKLPTRHDHFTLFAYDEDNVERSSMSIGDIDDCETIRLGIDGLSEGDYTIGFENVPGKTAVYLIDKLTGNYTEIESNELYNFYLTPEDEDRFVLMFSKSGVDCEEYSGHEELGFNLVTLDNGFAVMLDRPINTYKVEVVDMLGKVVYSSANVKNNSLRSEHFEFFNSGAYLVSIKDEMGQILNTEKFVIVR